MLKTIGKKFNRALHFDFHTPPGVVNIFGNFDAEQMTARGSAFRDKVHMPSHSVEM